MKTEKLEEDLCRCCHSEGAFKSIVADTEDVVYCDMLRECYGIELVALSEPLYRTLCAICDACIRRLQDAAEFKHQVQECEKVFRDLYLHAGKGNYEEKVSVYCLTEVKIEPNIDPIADGSGVNDDDFGASDHGDYEDNKLDVKEEHTPQVKEESEHDDFGMSGDHGDDEGVRVKEEEKYIPKGQKQRKHKQIKVPIFKAKKKKRVVRTRRKVAPSRDKNIVDTVQDYGFPQRRQQNNSNYNVSTHGSILKEKNEVVTPMNNVAPTIDEEIVNTVEVIKEPPPPVSLRKDFNFDYKWINKTFQCSRCEYYCLKLPDMHYHLRKNHNFHPQFSCSLCPEKFLTLAPFVEHKLKQHNIDDRFKCKACDRTFSAHSYLQKHMNTFHMLGEKFKCDLCDYETFVQTHISRHRKVHDDERNFHCQYCQRSFKRKSNLQCHERIHTGDKRQVCKECGQAFVQKASLNYHMNRYHPEVSF